MVRLADVLAVAARVIRQYLLYAGLWLLLSPQAAANTYHFYAIDKQPLATALTHFAEQSNLQILFRTQGVPAVEVGPLRGHYTPRAALTLLLQETQLQYTFGGTNAVVIYQPSVDTTTFNTTANQQPSSANTAAHDQTEHNPAGPDEIWVSGIRGSIARNLALKQNAEATVEMITSEEVGKFPDKNIADSLQRIPGVSVDRIWGEGRDINIRGTDKDINRTLMNGQNVASAYWWANDNPGRGFNYTILPAELISSLAVYKSPEADIDEGSIGGTVIIYTHKPFDMDSKTLRLTLEQQYSELPQTWDPQASLLGSWKNTEETFGILASLNWQDRSTRRDGLEAFPDNTRYTIADDYGNVTEDVYVIWGGGSAIFEQKRDRITSNITLQWSPARQWKILFNYVESSMEMDNSNQNYLFMPGGFKLRETPPVRVSEPRFGYTGDGRQTLLGGVMQNADSVGAALDAIFRQTYVRSAVYDIDVKYQGEAWHLHSQIGVTTAEGGSDHDRLYRFVGNTRERFSLSRDSIEVDYLDLDPEDASSLPRFSSESRDWIRKMEDEEFYAQADLQWELTNNFLSAIKTGLKWRDQVIENNRTVGSIDTSHPSWPQVNLIGLDQVSSELSPRLHAQTATPGSLTRFAWVDELLLKGIIAPHLDNELMVYRRDRAAFYRINEEITAAYVKGDFALAQWRGNLGIRAVHTAQTSTAYHKELRVTDSRSYQDYLPSINLAYDVNEEWIWRTSIAKVMARPTFQNLSSNIVIDGTSGTASDGNPQLQPFRAKQIDTGLEWYFDEAAILSATYFFKSISTYIYTETVTEDINGQSLHVTRPYNAEGARIAGLELQWQQDLGNGVGWLSNYTYTNARVPSPDKQQILQLPGNSRDQLNLSLYYENSAYSARLSYNYRSRSFGELIAGSQDETKAYHQWDLTASWAPTEETRLFIEGVNVTNEVIYYRTANDIPQGLYENGRRFSVGARLRF